MEIRPTLPDIDDPKVEFAYDYMGRRVRKQVRPWNGSDWGDPVADRKYVWSSWLLLMELDGLNSDAMVRKYAWGLDLAGQNGSINSLEEAGGIGGLLAAYDTAGTPGTADDRTFVYFYDANGNVGQLVETTGGGNYGTLAVKYEYDPYGNRLGDAAGGEYEQPFRFSTKQFDAEVTELYYFGYRYYSPGLGRWVSRDPIREAGGYNLYGFLQNRPVSFVDILGKGPYRLGSTPPPPLDHDVGSGLWGTLEPTLEARAAWLAWFNVALADEIYGYDDAARHLRHFLFNSGSTLEIDVCGMIEESPDARAHFYNELNQAMAFAERARGKLLGELTGQALFHRGGLDRGLQ